MTKSVNTKSMNTDKLILTCNAGSNSLKCALCEIDGKTMCYHFEADRIHEDTTVTITRSDGHVEIEDEPVEPGYENALNYFLGWHGRTIEESKLVAAGHRVVHGCGIYQAPVAIDQDVRGNLEAGIPFAPLHQPVNLELIDILTKQQPDLPQVACFDTSFHEDKPEVAEQIALPAEALGNNNNHVIKRYGFHGLSYEYIREILPDYINDNASRRVLIAHMGSGASACALKDGQCIDTTMGLTALDGFMMSTRPGATDPGLILHLIKSGQMSAEELEDTLYKESGLKGVSGGLSADMRDLETSDDPQAVKAVDLFCYKAARELGGLLAVMGGMDTLVFTGAMGVNDSLIRRRICAYLDWAGVRLDEDKNESNDRELSHKKSKVKILALPTNEEAVIARHAAQYVNHDDLEIKLRA